MVCSSPGCDVNMSILLLGTFSFAVTERTVMCRRKELLRRAGFMGTIKGPFESSQKKEFQN